MSVTVSYRPNVHTPIHDHNHTDIPFRGYRCLVRRPGFVRLYDTGHPYPSSVDDWRPPGLNSLRLSGLVTPPVPTHAINRRPSGRCVDGRQPSAPRCAAHRPSIPLLTVIKTARLLVASSFDGVRTGTVAALLGTYVEIRRVG